MPWADNMATKITPAEIVHRARVAVHQIEAARKQAVSVYDEDLRALKELDARLSTPSVLNEPEMFDVEQVLSPDLKQLIEAPLAKYGTQ